MAGAAAHLRWLAVGNGPEKLNQKEATLLAAKAPSFVPQCQRAPISCQISSMRRPQRTFHLKVCCITYFTCRICNIRHVEPCSSQATVEPLGCAELKVKKKVRTRNGLKSFPAGRCFRCRVEGQTAEQAFIPLEHLETIAAQLSRGSHEDSKQRLVAKAVAPYSPACEPSDTGKRLACWLGCSSTSCRTLEATARRSLSPLDQVVTSAGLSRLMEALAGWLAR